MCSGADGVRWVIRNSERSVRTGVMLYAAEWERGFRGLGEYLIF